MAQFNYTIRRNPDGSWSVINLLPPRQVVSTASTPEAAISAALRVPLFSSDQQVASAASNAIDRLKSQVLSSGYNLDGTPREIPPTPSPAENSAAQAAQIQAAGGGVNSAPQTVPTNADPTATAAAGAVTAGTQAPTVSTATSQAPGANVSPQQGVPVPTPPSPLVSTLEDANYLPPRVGGGQPGVADTGEDSVRNAVQVRVDSLYLQNQTVSPQPNILDKYTSYTYNISVYLMSPAKYRDFVNGTRTVIEPNTLLFQSGGAPVAPTTGPNQGPTRNQYFSRDFYIDNVEIQSVIAGKGRGSAHNSTLMTFTVTEYNGISLLQNLDRAVIDYIYQGDPKLKQAFQQNPDLGTWGSQIYMMTIRFYGYDQNGNLITGGTNTPKQGADPQAVIEKYIPFVIRNINFKIGNRAVEYYWDCATPATMVNTGPTYATVPYNCQLSGRSLQEALAGNLITEFRPDNSREPTPATPNTAGSSRAEEAPQPIDYSQVATDMMGTPISPQAIPGGLPAALGTTTPVTGPRPAAPANIDTKRPVTETVTQGLMAAMNRYQQEILNLGQIEIPNRYSVEFTSTALSGAQLRYRGRALRDQAGPDVSNNPRRVVPETQSADLNSRIFSVTAGQQLVQVMEMLIRNSTYISDQQSLIVDPDTGRQTTNPGRVKNLAWFKINMQASPIGFDYKRKDYAYDIKYVISEYRIVAPQTGYFPIVDFPGFHKSYPYWFTGENRSIMNFEQTYDFQYHRVLSGGILTDTTSANYLDFRKTVFYPRSGQSTQGGPLRTNEAAANLADYFYSPGDQKTVNLTVVGDPAWIFQGESAGSINRLNLGGNAFLADGTINVDYGQIFFEISWNSPEDYDNNGNGLMNPNKNSTQAGRGNQNSGTPKQSYAYGARTCRSHFRGGRFYQDLDGYLIIRNLNTQVSADNQRSQESQSAASSDRQLISRTRANVAPRLQEAVTASFQGGDFGSNKLSTVTGFEGLPNSPVYNPSSPGLFTLRGNVLTRTGSVANDSQSNQVINREE